MSEFNDALPIYLPLNSLMAGSDVQGQDHTNLHSAKEVMIKVRDVEVMIKVRDVN